MADTPETAFDPADPLARCSLDTARSHAALLDYWTLGPGRSLGRLAKQYRDLNGQASGEKPPTIYERKLEDWSSRGQWQERIKARAEIERIELERELSEERTRIIRRDLAMADKMSAVLEQMLEETPKFLKVHVQKGRPQVIENGVVVDKGVPTVRTIALNTTFLTQGIKLVSDTARRAVGMNDVQQIDLTNKGQAFETPVLYLPAVAVEDGNGQSAELEAEQPTAGAVSSDASIRGAVRRRGRRRKE